RDILNTLELDAEGLLEAARSSDVTEQYDRHTDEAIGDGILGAPAYVLDGEQFWGQDRVELLSETMASKA
ncbi:DsbA family protein, partial [Marinobacter sp. Hex_13]